MPSQNKTMSWAGWIITALVGAMLVVSATFKFLSPPDLLKEFERLGYPPRLAAWIGVAELCSALLFVIPRTAILGAVLLTGYLGGAIATHVRIGDNFAGAAIGGVLVWLAMYLRDPRVRALLPLRQVDR